LRELLRAKILLQNPCLEEEWQQPPVKIKFKILAGKTEPLAPTRWGPVGSTGLEFGKTDNDAPESTKNLKLCFVF
jgi:hypothetical protein